MTSYKTCAVPMCKSTTIKYPEKLFIHVPRCPKRRKRWLQLARRNPAITSDKSAIFFCEDHFELPHDMENYVQYCIMGAVGKIRIKPDCLPSKFQYQQDRLKQTAPTQPRSAVSKIRHNTVIQEILSKETKMPPTSGMTSSSGTPNKECDKNDLVVFNNRIPIVYTTKLDDMRFLRQKINNMHKDDIVDCIICESQPVLNSFTDMKPKNADLTSYNDLKVKLYQIFTTNHDESQRQKVSHESQRQKVEQIELSKHEKHKHIDTEFNLVHPPATKSEIESNDLNIFVVVIDCNGRQSMCTLSDLKDRLEDVNLTIANRTFSEQDVYILGADGCVEEFYTVIGNDTKLYENNKNQTKVVIDFCCWFQRNKGVYSMYPNCLSLQTLKFILKSHKCLSNRCLCCCRKVNDSVPKFKDVSACITTGCKKNIAVEQMKRHNFPSGTSFDIRIKEIDDDKDDIEELNAEIMDIDEQAPMILLEANTEDSSNIIITQHKTQPRSCPQILEHQAYITKPNYGFINQIESISNNKGEIDNNIQAPKTKLTKIEELSVTQTTGLGFEMYDTNDVKNNITREWTNYAIDIERQAVEPTILSFKLNETEINNQNSTKTLPRIENVYSLRWCNLPENESSHSTSAYIKNNNCVPKFNKDEQINVQPKIRVLSPSKLGVDTESNSIKNLIFNELNIAKPIGRTKSPISNKVKVTSEPSKFYAVSKLGEVPKFTKILPKPPETSNNIVKPTIATPISALLIPTPMDKSATSPNIPKKLSTKTPTISKKLSTKTVSIPKFLEIMPASLKKQNNAQNVPKLTTPKIMENIHKNKAPKTHTSAKPIILKKKKIIIDLNSL